MTNASLSAAFCPSYEGQLLISLLSKTGMSEIPCSVPQFLLFVWNLASSISGAGEMFARTIFIPVREGVACPMLSAAFSQLHGLGAVRIGPQIAINRRKLAALIERTVFDPIVEKHEGVLNEFAGRIVIEFSPTRR